jgi:hypothetical protein
MFAALPCPSLLFSSTQQGIGSSRTTVRPAAAAAAVAACAAAADSEGLGFGDGPIPGMGGRSRLGIDWLGYVLTCLVTRQLAGRQGLDKSTERPGSSRGQECQCNVVSTDQTARASKLGCSY